MKANADKNKVMVLNIEEGLECDILLYWLQLEHVSGLNTWVVFDK